MASQHETVAFLGTGTMGHGMASSALRAGLPTVVWNRQPEATKDLADLGADVADTAADAAARAGIVVTMVTNADAVMSIATDQGMLDALGPGAIWVQMSTVGVAGDRKSTRLNSSHVRISYAVFCLKKKKNDMENLSLPQISQDA